MIVPMKKVSLVILEKQKSEALKSLRKAGIVHLESVEGKGEKLAGYKSASAKLEQAVSLLTEVKVPKKGFTYESISNEEAFAKAEHVISITDRKKNLLDQISSSASEMERLSAWGIVNPADFDYLAGKGIFLSLYEIPSDKVRLISDDVKTIDVNSSRGVSRFLVLSDVNNQDRPVGLPPEAYQVVMPEKSTEEIAVDIQNAKAEVEAIEKDFASSVVYIKAMEKYNASLQKDIEFENVFSGMEGEGDEKNVNALSWLTGFVPADSMEQLKETAKANNWALTWDDPSDEDDVPTKLKNNKLVSLIYPLTDFLGTVPGYHEYDISGWFLLFFTVFFGMIFGDGGYGLLVTLIALLMIIKGAASKKPVPPMLGLVLLLGCSTVAWGFVTCTWFGLTPEQLPSWLTALSVKPLSNAYALLPDGSDRIWQLPWTSEGTGLTTANNLQVFCFTLALLQLCVAHLKGIARYAFDKKYKANSLKWIGEFGSFVQLIGMYWVVLSMVVSSEVFPLSGPVNGIPVGTIAIGFVLGGFVLGFVFANYEGSVGKSILESVKNIISVLLGVVNVFSDVVSYIRLWAVGLAGAAISGTVNTMAGPMIGHGLIFLAAVALLVFGHGLNMILNLLSVIVHGVRLNTLEFSNHLGMAWSGFKYQPFNESEAN